MKVKLVCGPAKSGKTKYIIKSFIENIQKNPVLIAPSAEIVHYLKHSILSENDLKGFYGRRILTFDNLVNILTEGIKELSYIGKSYLLRNIVSELQLKYFQPVKDYNGFYEVLGAFISELKHGQILPEDFLNCLQKRRKTDKDKELSAIYSVYQERLNGLNLYDHEGKFWQAQKILTEGCLGPFNGCKLLLVDGFQNFSPTELKILEAFGKLAGSMIITLTLEKNCHSEDQNKDQDNESFFIPTLNTYNRIKETFGPIEELVLSRTKTLIEKTQIIACPGQAREIEEIAKEIKRLITRYNKEPDEIAVLFRDLTLYKELIASEFRRYGIPYSISDGYPLRNSPVVRCIMGLFDIILGNWSRESVFNFLKSNYVIYQPDIDVNKINETCQKAGIIESKDTWEKKLSAGPEKDYISKFILAVEELEKESTPAVLRKLINFFGIETQIAEFNEPYLLKQEISAYSKFIEGLEELKEIKSSNIKTFYEYISMMIDTTEYSKDIQKSKAVQIMDVHRARGLSFPVVFIGGLLEKIFPKQIQEEPFYSDRERIELRNLGINIEEAKTKQYEELFLFYMAVHTAKNGLYLTYPATDTEGKEQLPSHYIDPPFLQKCGINYPVELKKLHISDIIPQLDSLYTKDYLFSRIMSSLWTDIEPNETVGLFNYLIKEKNPLFQETISNCFLHERECGILLDKKNLEIIANTFGKDYAFSISQFNLYGACPFSYFCRRLLYLEPIDSPEEEITPIDEGNIYHNILWEFYTSLHKEKDGNTVITQDETDEMVPLIEKVAEKHFQKTEEEALVNNMALWQIKKQEVLKNLKNLIFYEAETSNPYRKPAHFEISFGMKRKPLTPLDGKHLMDKASVSKPLVIDTVKIQGKIDRIDIIEPNMFSVIDYKAGAAQIRLSEIIKGTNIQLPIYILAIKELILKDMEPFEGYFCHVKSKKYFHANPLVKYKGSKPNLNWNLYIDSAIKYVKEYAKDIQAGKFPKATKKECPSYCDYKDICRN